MSRNLEITIIRTTSIGDVVLASATIDYLLKITQRLGLSLKLNWVGRSPSAELIDSSYDFVNVIYAPKEKSPYEITDKIRNSLFVIDLQVNPRSRQITKLFRKWSGRKSYEVRKFRWHRLKLVIAAFFRSRKRDLTDAELKPPERQFISAVKTLAAALLDHEIIGEEMAEAFGAARPTLHYQHQDSHRLFWNRLREGQWIAVSAGASFETKKAPKLIITEVLNRLKNSLFDIEVPNLVFLGDRNDTDITKTLIEELNWPAMTLDLTGKTNLYESLGILTKVKVIISNDSSLPHLAEAVGVDAAVLFGPTTEAFGFSPHRETSKAFSVPLGCRPCSKHGKKPCRFEDKQCFYEIDREEVMQFLRSKLELREDRDIRNFTLSNETEPETAELNS